MRGCATHHSCREEMVEVCHLRLLRTLLLLLLQVGSWRSCGNNSGRGSNGCCRRSNAALLRLCGRGKLRLHAQWLRRHRLRSNTRCCGLKQRLWPQSHERMSVSAQSNLTQKQPGSVHGPSAGAAAAGASAMAHWPQLQGKCRRLHYGHEGRVKCCKKCLPNIYYSSSRQSGSS